MKTMKVALLATAALAAVSVSARADDAAAVKAQLEALTARIAQLEAGPAMPMGYSLLAMSEVEQFTLTGEKASDVSATSTANRISILPTADMPATASITWSMEVRAALTHKTNVAHATNTTTTTPSITYEDDTTMKARGRIRAQAKTETSVGEVGVDIRLQATSGFEDFDGSTEGSDATMNIAYGWWAMTPEWTLGGGYTGSLSDPGHGMDSLAQFGTTIFLAAQGDEEQMRLTYASGPLTWAVALEDSDNHIFPGPGDNHMQLAVASRINYAGDAFSASLAGYYGPDAGKEPLSLGDDYWQVAAGATLPLGDIATFSANAAINSYDDVAATAYVSFDLTEAAFFEASAGHIWADATSANSDLTAYNAGIYWKPVDQLKIGLQADHIDNDVAPNSTSVSLVTWFSY